MMNKRLAIALLVCLPGSGARAQAIVRGKWFQPLNLSVAMADAVAVLAVVDRSSSVVRTEVVKILKGSFDETHLDLTVDAYNQAILQPLEAEKKYILFLQKIHSQPEPKVCDAKLFSESRLEATRDALKLLPAWPEPTGGISSILVPERFSYQVGDDINLWVLYRNVSTSDIRLTHRDLPLPSYPHWSLAVQSNAGEAISAVPNPNSSRERVLGRVSTQPSSFEDTIPPGHARFIMLPAINSGESGFSETEKYLDFKHYPIAKPGEYSIAALAHNDSDAPEPRTSAVKIRVEKSTVDPKVADRIEGLKDRWDPMKVPQAAGELGQLGREAEPAIPALLAARRELQGLFLTINTTPDTREEYHCAAEATMAALQKIREAIDEAVADGPERAYPGPVTFRTATTLSFELTQGDPWMRAYAARALAHIAVKSESHAQWIANSVQEALGDNGEGVRKAATGALRQILESME